MNPLKEETPNPHPCPRRGGGLTHKEGGATNLAYQGLAMIAYSKLKECVCVMSRAVHGECYRIVRECQG